MKQAPNTDNSTPTRPESMLRDTWGATACSMVVSYQDNHTQLGLLTIERGAQGLLLDIHLCHLQLLLQLPTVSVAK